MNVQVTQKRLFGKNNLMIFSFGIILKSSNGIKTFSKRSRIFFVCLHYGMFAMAIQEQFCKKQIFFLQLKKFTHHFQLEKFH
jgi:hypothetical protein